MIIGVDVSVGVVKKLCIGLLHCPLICNKKVGKLPFLEMIDFENLYIGIERF